MMDRIGASAAWLGMLAALLSTSLDASAQTFVPAPVDEPGFVLQLEKPFLPFDGLDFYSSNIEADVLLPLSTGRSVAIGVPLAVAGADGAHGTSFYLGNLRASLLFGTPGDPTAFLGVTVPTASNIGGPDLAVLVGALPWLNELEKWSDDAVSFRGAWIPSRSLDEGRRVGLRLGGSAVMPTDFENLFVFARAAGWGSISAGGTELRVDLNVSYDVTGDDGFGEQFTSYIDLGVALQQAAKGSTLFLRVPLDGDARDVLDLSVGWRIRF